MSCRTALTARFLLRALPLGCALLATAWARGAGGPLAVVKGAGRLEIQATDGTWAPQAGTAAITTALRSGTGRATLRAGSQGQIVMGSVSQLRRYRDEADLTRGRFLLRGPVAVHVQGHHLVMEGAGQIRVNLAGATQRVPVISGSLRIDLDGQLVQATAGPQVALRGGAVTAFQESDPWYAAQFRGEGDATVGATCGPVRLGGAVRVGGAVHVGGTAPEHSALVGDALSPGDALKTGAAAWVEIGFTGGGHLRLNEQGELSVLSVEKTTQGREVLLRLARGTTWNVVHRGQGGYRIDTPIVSTAVRGTVFRVDASGVVKVFEGQVALLSQGDQPVAQGQERTPGGSLAPLVTDAVDQFNQTLDAQRRSRWSWGRAP